MIIYNVTINIADEAHDDWLQWMQEQHIPDMLATGKFSAARLVRVLVEEEMGGTTYSVQYQTDSRETLQRYYAEDADTLRQDGARRFADKFVAFRTELQIISDHK